MRVTTVEGALREGALCLAQGGSGQGASGELRRDVRLLLGHALGMGTEAVFSHPERTLSDDEARRFRALVKRRSAREPVSRIVGMREFWSLPLRLGQGVFDPRPESETVVEAVLDRLIARQAPPRLLDLGTGSGALLLALLSEQGDAQGIGVDASEAAVGVARANAARLKLAARAQFIVGDWGDGLIGPFDVIVSNPPYIARAAIPDLAPEVARFDPFEALCGGADGLDAYRALAPRIARLLAPNGFAAIEIGAGQAAAVVAIFRQHGLARGGERRDLGGIPRCLTFTRIDNGDGTKECR
jgi:release factor glutamine methyltransferase